MAPNALTPVSEMRLGDHLCFAFTDEQERQLVLASFVRDGLTVGDTVLWLTGDTDPAAVLEVLRCRGVRPDAAVASGQLVVRGCADPPGEAAGPGRGWTAATLLEEAVAMLDGGCRSLRVTIELGRVPGRAPGAEGLLWYETRLAKVLATGRAMAICQYDRRRVAPEVLVAVHQAHAGRVGANPEFRDQLLRVSRTFQPCGLRLEGEIDMTNRAGLAQALAAATAAAEGDLHLDLSGLEFMHVDGLRLLVETAVKLPDGRYLVLDCVPAHLRRIIALVGWDRTPGLKLGGELR